ncbi:ROK family transcriptional regulator [Arthrobacter nitrophenolicus]|jgi:predicted NBD/HSP70 family sugar kinase|uniref:ROK family protein n=1 Tax=Arthrobacter nitrophenolicus TaxID=683150 RepID=A0A4V3B2A9_9MICC|nr:ROK family protein [Arthrobacter nitrophenolicus]TDL39758.1 ROK family protein [Arthrobacter nitrophenolicus]
MHATTANSTQLLRQINSEALLRFALQEQVFTAGEAMAETGLTRATVLGVCDGLVDAGWLEEVDDGGDAGRALKGRPARRYRLREAVGVVVGLDAGETSFTTVVADLRGRELGSRREGLDSHALGRAGRCEKARELIGLTLADAGLTADDVLLTVVGVPAPVDAGGASPAEGEFWQLMNCGFARHLQGRVVVDNDANLAAIAELALEPSANVATLLTGERFGAGLIVDGRLLRGPRGGAGEMRFLDAFTDDKFLPEEGSTDGFGALARKWARSGINSFEGRTTLRDIPEEQIKAEDVFHAAREGDPLGKDIIARLGARLAKIAVVLSSLLDIERVVIAGGISRAVDPVLEHARSLLPSDTGAPLPELVASTLGAEAVVQGAVESALARIRQEPSAFLPRAAAG